MKYQPFKNPAIKQRYSLYPKYLRAKMMELRELIYQTACNHDEIGQIEETIKWDTTSYLTFSPKSGTTIRLSGDDHDNSITLSVHCQSRILSDFKVLYPKLKYDGNRSIIFNVNQIPMQTVKHFIYAALTYHYRKKRGIGI